MREIFDIMTAYCYNGVMIDRQTTILNPKFEAMPVYPLQNGEDPYVELFKGLQREGFDNVTLMQRRDSNPPGTLDTNLRRDAIVTRTRDDEQIIIQAAFKDRDSIDIHTRNVPPQLIGFKGLLRSTRKKNLMEYKKKYGLSSGTPGIPTHFIIDEYIKSLTEIDK